jgi:ribonuclease P protein subunit RPR2
MRGSKPEWQIKIARERIAILFEEARRIVAQDKKLANRYVALARRIGMRYNVRIPHALKRHICKGCKAYLAPATARYSTKGGVLRITCKACGRINRYPLAQRK